MRQDKQLWRRCRELADSVPMPAPFRPDTFAQAVAAHRGRRIELMPVPATMGAPCGLLMTTDHADYILYPVNTTELHQQHIFMHEVAHLLCGHTGTGEIDAAATRVLMPNLSPELVRRVLGRTVYTETEEHEAELLASLIAQRAARLPRPPSAEPPDEVVQLSRLFGVRRRDD
ncbi:toxin-antitoxin system, toxin component [Kutzneria sp. 744]|nr:toxin-antitoxin system, toxin component [Kutzneria sp. 744]